MLWATPAFVMYGTESEIKTQTLSVIELSTKNAVILSFMNRTIVEWLTFSSALEEMRYAGKGSRDNFPINKFAM
jgi:hypothetical protein